MLNRNVEGMPYVAATSRHAPDTAKLRTVRESCACPPRIIVPDLSVRWRGVFLWLPIGFASNPLNWIDQVLRPSEERDRTSKQPERQERLPSLNPIH